MSLGKDENSFEILTLIAATFFLQSAGILFRSTNHSSNPTKIQIKLNRFEFKRLEHAYWDCALPPRREKVMSMGRLRTSSCLCIFTKDQFYLSPKCFFTSIRFLLVKTKEKRINSQGSLIEYTEANRINLLWSVIYGFWWNQGPY